MGVPSWFLRKLIHGVILGVGFLAVAVCVISLIYAPIHIGHALVIGVPGAFYFGAIALFAATLTRRASVGYIVGIAAVVMSYLFQFDGLLSFLSYSIRDRLDTLRYLMQYNWIISKAFFLLAGVAIVGCSIDAANHTNRKRLHAVVAPILLLICNGLIGFLWSREEPKRAEYADGSIVLEVKENDGHLFVVTAQNALEWFGTYRKGVIALDGQSVRQFSAWNSALPHNMAPSLAIDSQGRVWAATCEGVASIDANRVSVYTAENSGLPGNRVRALLVDSRNRLWAGTDRGIASRNLNINSKP